MLTDDPDDHDVAEEGSEGDGAVDEAEGDDSGHMMLLKSGILNQKSRIKSKCKSAVQL